MPPIVKKIISNQALSFILLMFGIGLLLSLIQRDLEGVGLTFGVCAILWVCVGFSTLSKAIKAGVTGLPHQGFQEGMGQGLLAALYGPFAYKLFP